MCGESWPWNLGVLVLSDGPSTGKGGRTVHCVPCPDLFKDSKSRASLKPRKSARWPNPDSRSTRPRGFPEPLARAVSGLLPPSHCFWNFQAPHIPPSHLGCFKKDRDMGLEIGLLDQVLD